MRRRVLGACRTVNKAACIRQPSHRPPVRLLDRAPTEGSPFVRIGPRMLSSRSQLRECFTARDATRIARSRPKQGRLMPLDRVAGGERGRGEAEPGFLRGSACRRGFRC